MYCIKFLWSWINVVTFDTRVLLYPAGSPKSPVGSVGVRDGSPPVHVSHTQLMSNSFRSYTSSVPSDPPKDASTRADWSPPPAFQPMRRELCVLQRSFGGSGGRTAVFLCGSLHSLYSHCRPGKQCRSDPPARPSHSVSGQQVEGVLLSDEPRYTFPLNSQPSLVVHGLAHFSPSLTLYSPSFWLVTLHFPPSLTLFSLTCHVTLFLISSLLITLINYSSFHFATL